MLLPIPFAVVGFIAFLNLMSVGDVKPEANIYITLVLPADDAWCLGKLGRLRDQAGDLEQAAVFYRAAATIDRSAWQYHANLARTCLQAKRWEDAEGALREARKRRSGAERNAAIDDWFREMEESIDAGRKFWEKPVFERRKAPTM